MSDFDQNVPHEGGQPQGGPGPQQEAPHSQEYSQQAPPPPRGGYSTIPPDHKSVGGAALLSCFPGLGQVYAGYPRRGIQIALTVAGLIMILNAGGLYMIHPFAGIMLAFAWCFNIIDAARCARIYNQIADGASADQLTSELPLPLRFGGRGGGIFLVGLGGFLLLVTLFDFSLAFLEEWWPAGLIGLGLWMIRRERD
jgi:TM2 domain-containing membrane protein YozV